MKYAAVALKRYAVGPIVAGINVSAVIGEPDWPRLIRTTDIDGPRALGADVVRVDPKLVGSLDARPGDLLVCRTASLGTVLLVPEGEPAAFAGYLVRVRLDRRRAVSGFVGYWSESSMAQSQIAAGAIRSTVDNFNARKVANLKIPSVPLDEQRRIADFLDGECDRIAKLLSKLDTLATSARDAFAQRVAEELARPAAPVRPLAWAVDPARPIMYGIVLPGEPVEDGVLLVKGGNVERGQLEPQHLVKVAPAIEQRFARSRLRAGDLLMTIRGSFGAVAVVPEVSAGANITQDTARITPTDVITGRYLVHALRGADAQRQIHERVRGAGVRGLNIFDLKRIQLPFPAIEVRDRIASLLDARTAEMVRARADMQRFRGSLCEYRDALIAEAVTGRLDVSRLSDAQLDESGQAASEGERPEVLSA